MDKKNNMHLMLANCHGGKGLKALSFAGIAAKQSTLVCIGSHRR